MRWLLVLLLFLPSCGLGRLFEAEDLTPLVISLETKRKIALDSLDSNKKLIEESDLSSIIKQEILDEIARSREQYLQLDDKDVELIKSRGELDYKELYEKIKEL